ncbi:MAG: amidohydrolase family protein, partial [Burkholderiaceae bacterium]
QLPFGEAEPGVIGLELLLPLTLKWASEDKQSIEKAISLLTQGPAKILRRDCATLSVGGQADLCVFSPDEPWLVTNDTLYSQGRNTPYIGREILGRVRATIIDGRSVFTRSASA